MPGCSRCERKAQTLSRELGTLTSAYAVKKERRSGMEADLKRLAAELEDVAEAAEVNRSEAALATQRIGELEKAQQDIRIRIEECGPRHPETAGVELEGKQKLAAERTTPPFEARSCASCMCGAKRP